VDWRDASSVGVKFVLGLRGLGGLCKRSVVIDGGTMTSDLRLGTRRRLGDVVCSEAGTSAVGWSAGWSVTPDCPSITGSRTRLAVELFWFLWLWLFFWYNRFTQICVFQEILDWNAKGLCGQLVVKRLHQQSEGVR
jgi:hypothetical protein